MWVVTLAGVGLWVHGWVLRDSVRGDVGKVAQEWDVLEERRLEVERALLSLLAAGHYNRGLVAYLEATRVECENLRTRIAVAASILFVASLSGTTVRKWK